jgi:hypothetical protein
VVVLLDGGALDRTMWDQQMPALAADHRVIRLDARGHGDWSTPREPFRHCDDVVALLDHLGVGSAALAGLSMTRGCSNGSAGGPTPFATVTSDAWIDTFLEIGAIGPRRDATDVAAGVVEQCREMAVRTVTRHESPARSRPTPAPRAWERLGEIAVPVLGIIGTTRTCRTSSARRSSTTRSDGSSSG